MARLALLHRIRHRLGAVLCLLALVLGVAPVWASGTTETPAPKRFVAVAFHDVADSLEGAAADTVSTDTLVAFFDHLRGEGWTPLSLEDLRQIRQGSRRMPDKAILITFDDGYRSLYTHVFPLLMAYRIPVVASLVGRWLEPGPGSLVQYGDRLLPRERFIDWQQARRMQASGLVEFGSHTHDQHHLLTANPQGNANPALSSLIYDPTDHRYESLGAYRERVRQDLARNDALLLKELGRRPRAVAWPYGQYNTIAMEVAAELGHEFALTLHPEPGEVARPLALGRQWVQGRMSVAELMNLLRFEDRPPATRRLQRVDPSTMEWADPAAFNAHLGRLIDTLRDQRITDVVMPAVHHDRSTGLWTAWFPTRTMTLRADVLHRLSSQLNTRVGVRTWVDVSHERLAAWMPPTQLLQLHTDLGWQVPLHGLVLSQSAVDSGDRTTPSRAAAVSHSMTRSTWQLLRARRDLRPDDLGSAQGLALQAFHAVAASRPELQLLTLTPAGATHTLTPWADLALLAMPADLSWVKAHADGLRSASADRDGRRTGVWLISPKPLDEEALAPLRRALQVQGVGALGSGPVDF